MIYCLSILGLGEKETRDGYFLGQFFVFFGCGWKHRRRVGGSDAGYADAILTFMAF